MTCSRRACGSSAPILRQVPTRAPKRSTGRCGCPRTAIRSRQWPSSNNSTSTATPWEGNCTPRRSASGWPSTPTRISRRHPETVRTGGRSMRKFALPGIGAALIVAALAFASGGAAAGPPGYEPAYFGGETVTINAIEVKQNEQVLEHASAELYAVVYPLVARNAGLVPQCNPCDHAGNGIDPGDFHDHVLDSIPADPGGGEFSPLWHVLAVRPNYTADPAHNACGVKKIDSARTGSAGDRGRAGSDCASC